MFAIYMIILFLETSFTRSRKTLLMEDWVSLPWYGLERVYSRFKNSSISWSSSAKHGCAIKIRNAKVHCGLKGIIFRRNGILDSPERRYRPPEAIVVQNTAHRILPSFLLVYCVAWLMPIG